jgi:hypothetical protein
MRRLWPVLLALLGLTLLAAAPASAAVAAEIENRTSGLPAGSNNLVGIEPQLSENAVRENARLAYEGASGSPVAAKQTVREIRLSRSLHGEAAEHAADAIKAGKPSVLTIDRAGAAANRQASIGSLDKVSGKHLDEYPPAMFKEGGAGASVRAISPRDNLSAGACIGNACRALPDGTQVRITVGD